MTTYAAVKQRTTKHDPQIIHGGHPSEEQARQWLVEHLRSKATESDWPPNRTAYDRAANALEVGGEPTLFGSIYKIIPEAGS